VRLTTPRFSGGSSPLLSYPLSSLPASRLLPAQRLERKRLCAMAPFGRNRSSLTMSVHWGKADLTKAPRLPSLTHLGHGVSTPCVIQMKRRLQLTSLGEQFLNLLFRQTAS